MDDQGRKTLLARRLHEERQRARRFGFLLVFLAPVLILGLSGSMTALDRLGSALFAVLPLLLLVGGVGFLGVWFVATVTRVILAYLQDALDALFLR